MSAAQGEEGTPEATSRLLDLLTMESAEDVAEVLRALRVQGALQEVADAARSHGLTPALYHRLRYASPPCEDAVWESLEADYWATAARNTQRYHELGLVLAALRARDVRVLLLKGAALAETIYDNIALRPMGDVDLLVPRSHLREAIAILQALGYRRDKGEAHPGFAAEYENEIAFIHPTSEMAVELHWHLIDAEFYMRRIPEEALWKEAVPLRIAEHPVEAFGPEATLVYLPAHWVLHHHAHGLRWLYDMDRLVRHYQGTLDWAKIAALAQAWCLVLPLQTALRQCGAHMHTPIPAAVMESLEAIPVSAQEQRAFAYLTSPRRDVISRFYRDLVMIQGVRRKVRYLWYSIFPNRDYMMERYTIPEGRPVWSYHVLRVTKGLWQLGYRLVANALARLRGRS